MNTEIKLCRDCKYIKRTLYEVITKDYAFSKCGASITISPVHVVSGAGGKIKFEYCDFERASHQSLCGPSGKNFEAKK